ncbi:hypothetical protein BEN47_11830 [Hymenobacter lapidarius]|uniref:Uncharacterized protein n=1 Tax=Hymenobacter lapidarius TaxID=1908237 RepID=A0A1G1T8E9_9BACT|nr:hypothetical protein BEN47_11830 [Hymenobacter lapidarius]
MLVDHLAQSTPGEEAVLFSHGPDGNGGQELPPNPLIGEALTGTPIIPPASEALAVALEKAPEQVKD